jgi:outer membrane receptor protein involved in Fe transport
MKKLSTVLVLVFLQLIFLVLQTYAGTTGKVAGTILDKKTGDPLFGASVTVQGTNLGAATDANGHFTILFVPPGTYNVKVSFVGYETIVMNDVRVYIDQTARVDLTMQEQDIKVAELVVYAQKTLIKADVSTSVVSVSDNDVKQMPITNVISAIGLQAGVSGGWGGNPNYADQPDNIKTYSRQNASVQGGISIRGGSGDNILFMLDGITLRDPRNNEPITSIPMSAVKEVSIERGGFNAEYGPGKVINPAITEVFR